MIRDFVDVWRWAYDIATDNNKLVIRLGGIRYVLNLPSGQYISADRVGDLGIAQGVRGLYYEILSEIDALTGRADTVEAADVDQSGSFSGVSFVALGSGGFWFDFDDPDFTLSPLYLGFAEDATTAQSQAAWNPLTESHTSPLSVYGQWIPRPLHGCASVSKIADRSNFLQASGQRPDRAYQIRWSQLKTRRVKYTLVPAGNVRTDRADLEPYARVAGLNTGDSQATYEELWEAGALLSDIYVYYSVDAGANLLDDTPNGEVTRFGTAPMRETLGSSATVRVQGGELYDLTIDLAIIRQGYKY